MLLCIFVQICCSESLCSVYQVVLDAVGRLAVQSTGQRRTPRMAGGQGQGSTVRDPPPPRH